VSDPVSRRRRVPLAPRRRALVGSFAEKGIGKMRQQAHRFRRTFRIACACLVRKQVHRISSALRIACACLLIMAAFAARAGDVQGRDDTTASVTLATIDSAQTGAVYKLYVYLPDSYATGNATYPVIYATDGDAAFPPEGRFVNFTKILQRRRIDAILVGIGGTERRNKDFLLPGAKAYHEFITQELIPFIDSHFRTDPKRRILSGISYGGAFVVTSLFLEAPDKLYFSDYISAEGSFFLRSFIAQERAFSGTIGTRSIPATLILARGSVTSKVRQQEFSAAIGSRNNPAMSNLARDFNEATNGAEVAAFYRRMVDRHYPGLILIQTHFPTDHIGTDNPSFEDAVVRILKSG
jgi:predicted alpha/beta superfamily hydrolase